MPKVSVIVPVYQVDWFLSRTLDSILNQTHRDLEVLLVNDCSPDDSGRVMEAYRKRDSRVKCLYQKINSGVSAARNRGLDAATGDWICFCDGDDWFQQDYIEKMLACGESLQADFVVCDYQRVTEGQSPAPGGAVDALESGCGNKLAIALGPISSCTHLFRRELFDRAGVRYPENCLQYEELPVVPVLAKYAHRIGVVKEPLYNYYQRGDGTSASNAPRDYRRNFETARDLMGERLGPGYEPEMEYHTIYGLFYGEILLLCRQRAKGREIRKRLRELEWQYPDYLKNPYLRKMALAKRLFLLAGAARQIWVLRAYARLHSILVQ